jgi:hypothetical protein
MAWAMQAVRLIVESVTFATTLVSLTLLLRDGGCFNKKVARFAVLILFHLHLVSIGPLISAL